MFASTGMQQHALHPRQLRYSLPNWTPRPAFSTLCRLPAGTDHAAQPSHRHEQRAARRPAGRRSPTKPMLSTASIDANQAANAPGLGARSMTAALRPAARRRPAPARPVLHLGRESAAKIRHLAQVAAADFVHLHHSDAELINHCYANGAMDGGPGGSTTPATASLAATQQEKPKSFRAAGRDRPAGVGGGENAAERT